MNRRVLSIVAVQLLACSPSSANSTPDGAVREFIEVSGSFQGKESDAQTLFSMLSERSKSNLRARAERYGAASGRKIAPAAMLVPSRFTPSFRPRHYRSEVRGKYALVDVLGNAPRLKAQIPCVYEEQAWRVDIVLPELPPLPKRD